MSSNHRKKGRSTFDEPYKKLKEVKLFENKRTNLIIKSIWLLLFILFLLWSHNFFS